MSDAKAPAMSEQRRAELLAAVEREDYCGSAYRASEQCKVTSVPATENVR